VERLKLGGWVDGWMDEWCSGRYEEDRDPKMVDGRQGLRVVAKFLRKPRLTVGCSAAADGIFFIVKSMKNCAMIFTGLVFSSLLHCFSFPSLLQRGAIYKMYSRTAIETLCFTLVSPRTLSV
jgi:hypothetical protein